MKKLLKKKVNENEKSFLKGYKVVVKEIHSLTV